MKKIYELSIDELKARRKLLIILDMLFLLIGMAYWLIAIYFYLETLIIGLPVMLMLVGQTSLIVAMLPSNIDLWIYLKMKELNDE